MMITSDYTERNRFERMERIDWIDMDSIHSARCLVVGAGALGNEVVKDLVLSGFRDVTVVDMDYIVLSNLSRCLFFRESDIKTVMKADIVAERASELDPDVRITPKVMKIQDLDDWDYDIILGCLDNVQTRMHVNAHAYFHDVPYIDGATDGMNGKVQVVLPNGPCFQCLMNRTHARDIDKHFSCTGHGTAFVPKMAADITTTSIIAGMQVREAIKIASKRQDLCIKHISYYDGITGESETLELHINEGCPNHLE